MPTYQVQSTAGDPVSVIYPAERPSGQARMVHFRVGKKATLPAYAAANFPHLVQFRVGQRIVMFLLSDILETSYWRKIRNAFTWCGQLDIDDCTKLDSKQSKQIVQWLNQQRAT